MLLNQWEQNQLAAVVAGDFQYVDELLKNVRAGAHSEDSGALEGTVFLPFADAVFAKEFAAIVTLHWLTENF